MKEREKGGVNCLKSVKIVIGWYKLQLWMWLVDLDKNFEFDWLIELCDNKLSNNLLSDNNLASELVEDMSFLIQSQSRNCNFYD